MSTPHACLVLYALLAMAPAITQEGRDRTTIVDNEFNRNSSVQDVIMMLVKELGKSEVEARDAASKLSQVGKPAVPILADLLARAPSEQIKYYAALALSRVRDSSAADALLPLVTNAEAPREMRLMAIDAAANSNLDSATASLAQLAGSEDDAELRMKALLSLSVMPVAWRDGEGLFVKCLDDPDDEIRLLATKVCFYAAAVRIVYGAAEPKLLTLVENDSSMTVRCQSLRALGRMKSGRAVPLSVSLLSNPVTPASLRGHALAAIRTVTDVPLKDEAAVQTWWEKYGKARYANAPALRPFTVKSATKTPEEEKGGETAQPQPRLPETATTPPANRPPVHAGQPVRTQPPPSVRPDGTKRLQLDGSDDDEPIRGLPIR